MLNISKINYYIKIFTDEEENNFPVVNFSDYFKTIREKQNLGKVAKSLYIFLTTPGEVEKYDQIILIIAYVTIVEILTFFDPELQLVNTKPVLKIKLVLEYKERNSRKIFH